MSCGPSASLYDLSGNRIQDTYQRIVQVIPNPTGSVTPDLYDGMGSKITALNIDTAVSSSAFSGSFYGDGTNITGVTAASAAYSDITDTPTLISGSAQVDHNTTTNYVANEHIDWTNATEDLTTTGTLTTGPVTFSGGITHNRTEVSQSTFTPTADDYILGVTHTTGSGATIQLDLAANQPNQHFVIKDEGFSSTTNNIILQPSGSELIDNNSSYTIAINGVSISIYSTGTAWFIY